MEIKLKKTQNNQMSTGKGYLFRACSSKEITYLHVDKNSKTGKGVGKGFQLERREGFRCALIGGSWLEEAVDRLIRSRASCVIV